MKQVPLFLVVVFNLITLTLAAQSAVKAPKWFSEKGYWIVESNINTPKSATIYFYNNNNELVHKEKVEGKRINVNKKAVCKRLESMLVQSVRKWEQDKIWVKKD